ncbi:MAG: ABC transporter substrate-binding protein [Aestuariivirga sp.]|uniref:extracellular solute-binding protein n=1 Tax=Aestuariivirga sp. TaxID=2650926 RepID=UPI0025B8A69B|nr:extracellular solute-binding protein [Aestuariivirga sp.]MCA3562548.1 ABC transporter substrate-binding protein [Aestuariivirga sp.]
MSKLRRTALLATAFLAFTSLAQAEPKHGIAMLGEPALPQDFKNLPYVNPDAPQGGELRQAITGAFDSVNPFIVKGQAVIGPRTYVFESLLGRNWNEPFSLYGLIAETIDVSDDRQTFTFKLRPEAKFSDGSPITAADVVFSMETLRDKGRPNFKKSYSKITKVATPDDHTVIFHQDSGDRELPMIVGLMPILPKTQWQGKDFSQSTLEPLMGSGPYVMDKIKAGESIAYRKNPDYWGKTLPISKGLWNFDTVRFDYYRDANAAFEAFKAGLADVRIETDPTRWNTGYTFPAVNDGKIALEKVDQKTPAPAAGFVFNTRRPLFQDPRVREALLMAFDFEWANANLFNNAYHRTFGYYGGSELSSEGKPADEAEKKVLGDALAKLRPDFVDGSYRLPVSDGSGRDRKMLRKAVGLLDEAGWTVGDKGLVNAQGEPFVFTILVKDRDQEKIALHYQRTLQAIGITANVRIVDPAQFLLLQNSYEFDMIPWTWFNSLSPGNEQNDYFGSDGRTIQGSRNMPGIADPAVDRAILAMLDAKTRDEFVAAVRAEDRLLTSGFYMVPFYNAGGQWVARWNTIGRPDAQPLTGFETTALWRNK